MPLLKPVCKALEQQGIGKGWRVYVTHATAPALAASAKEAVLSMFPDVECEVYSLTPAFITQGGPGCVAIQSIRLL